MYYFGNPDPQGNLLPEHSCHKKKVISNQVNIALSSLSQLRLT